MGNDAREVDEVNSNVREQIFDYFEWVSDKKYKYCVEGKTFGWFENKETWQLWHDFLPYNISSVFDCACEKCARIVEEDIKGNTALSVEEVQAFVDFHEAFIEADTIVIATYVVKDMICHVDKEADAEKGYELLHQAAKKAFAVFEKRGRTIYKGPSFFKW